MNPSGEALTDRGQLADLPEASGSDDESPRLTAAIWGALTPVSEPNCLTIFRLGGLCLTAGGIRRRQR